MHADDETATARRLWLVGEPIHALIYFAQPAFDVWEAAGVTGFWRGYFAMRAAPFGAVGPEVVTASFYNFDPAMVAKALPSVWDRITPAGALAARLAGMDAALAAVVGGDLGADALSDPAIGATAATLREVVAAAPVSGRALFGANTSLPWPDPPHLALWHGLTCLREHRGDGHNAALTAAGIDGCQAHVLAGAAGGTPRDVIQPTRGWSDERWDASVADLVARALLTADGKITDEGRRLHAHVEAVTDALAAAPWAAVGPERTEAAIAALRPWALAIQRAGTIRQPNPMGLPPLPT